MRALPAIATALFLAVPVHAADPLSEARRLYNQGQLDGAERAARKLAEDQDPGRMARLAYTYFHIPIVVD